MGFLLPILLALFVSLLGGLYLLGAFRRRRPGEPPLDKVQLGGFYLTFITDPHSFGAMIKESRTKLDFHEFAQVLVERVFGYRSLKEDDKFIQASSNNIGSSDNGNPWQEAGLFYYCYNIVFRAGYLALFGNETPKTSGGLEKAKEMDRNHSDELFQKIEAEHLKRLFWNMLSVHKGNTGPASFWLLLFLMKHPDAMKAIRNEVEEVLRETKQEVKHGGPLINLTRDMLLKTPVLDSAVEESLRMTAAPVLTRAVLQDMTLKMADGQQYNIRKGDRVALFPYITLHMDPEVHPDPHTYKYDRFLTPEGAKKTEFYKGGKKLKYYTMPWGAGATMCPGRFFATNELKQFVFLMLTYFDFELINPDEKIPDIDTRRWGFGTMQPTKDVQFRYRLRFTYFVFPHRAEV
ncbi:hypothetical protein NFI96_004630 [Prochilodus magdalenae]|nr:hypothetical protein NFI96_004630 [Prochilodus magdalenae]